jgi:hypothetical protein
MRPEGRGERESRKREKKRKRMEREGDGEVDGGVLICFSRQRTSTTRLRRRLIFCTPN